MLAKEHPVLQQQRWRGGPVGRTEQGQSKLGLWEGLVNKGKMGLPQGRRKEKGSSMQAL